MILFKMEWKRLYKGFLIWTLLFAGLSFAFSAIYPQMFTPSLQETMDTMLSGLPESMLTTFNISLTGEASMFKPVGFFAYYFQYLFIAACIYASLLGMQSLISEESEGTIDFLYAQPISRQAILFSKFIARLTVISFFWLLSGLSSMGSLLVFRLASDPKKEIISGITKIYFYEWLVLLFFLTLGFLVSSLLKNASHATSLSLALVFGFYLLGILSGLQEKLNFLSNWSPVHLGIPSSILNNGLPEALYLGLLSGIFLAASFYCYIKRDFQS
ncbi:MAG TPA: ABC transporter permease [Candidatus Enterococcus avicola]|uniref:ABC transporter permease n=1 Tax=Candidatus Enterococcus avicola TaxID=2838561 RepID=A0A9D2F7Z1_9ENTE|nr:ABC transporter permease [Candidatus Enterococcus avicola]